VGVAFNSAVSITAHEAGRDVVSEPDIARPDPQEVRSLEISLPEAIEQLVQGDAPTPHFTLPPITFLESPVVSSPPAGMASPSRTQNPPTTPPSPQPVENVWQTTFHPTNAGQTSTGAPSNVTFEPGVLVSSDDGLRLSKGLTARVFARSDEKVQYYNFSESLRSCHQTPDGAATFQDTRESNQGGWIYVSNSEENAETQYGGVGSFTFDTNGNLIDYRMVLEGSIGNCNGGTTPWGAWISCEERDGGQIWQVDPTGVKPPGVITLGMDGGKFESYAHTPNGKFHFVTEDDERGALRRFTPDSVDMSEVDPWNLLYGAGKTEFLILDPKARTFQWTTDEESARVNAELYYPGSEGIAIRGSMLFFVSKYLQTLYSLNLIKMVYTSQSTVHGGFEAQPDAIQTIQDNIALLYFTEDESTVAGVHARDHNNKYFTILEAPGYVDEETTGLAFSPDHRHLYFTLQKAGVFFDVTRDDGRPFEAETLPVKHANRLLKSFSELAPSGQLGFREP
jgi:Bacterial protein of unknown function (DUF839)